MSIEVDPRHAHDTDATIAEARALWWAVDRPNLYLKIPASRQGLPAITECLAEGISINVTLIFSLDRYDEVMGAFLEGMERARQAGLDLTHIGSVASFFVSRVDTEVDARLDKLGTATAADLRGQAAIANARLAYERYEQMISTPRWQALHAAGARPQRPLWASTSTKDPGYADTRYVVDLIAPGVVNTMPEATLRAVADHGHIPTRPIRDTYAEAHTVIDELGRIGIDYDDVVQQLEDDGIHTFEASWDHLRAQIEDVLRTPSAPPSGGRDIQSGSPEVSTSTSSVTTAEPRNLAAVGNSPSDEGGDSACWANRVCKECGRLSAAERPRVCEACGATFD